MSERFNYKGSVWESGLCEDDWMAYLRAKQAVETLESMRETIESGWCQGREAEDEEGFEIAPEQVDEGCKVCLTGAILFEARLNCWPREERDYDYLQYALGVAIGGDNEATASWSDLQAWNDTTGRTKRQVVQAINRAIKLEERGAPQPKGWN